MCPSRSGVPRIPAPDALSGRRYFEHINPSRSSNRLAARSRAFPRHRRSAATMLKKILIGLAAVAVLCVLARSGYEFGKRLAHGDKAEAAQASTVDPARD